jgi:hypothetical protein
MVTQTVSTVRVNDIISEAINSVIIEYEKLLSRVEHKNNIKILRVVATTHI